MNRTNVKRRQLSVKMLISEGEDTEHITGRSVAHTCALGAKIIRDYYAGVILI